MSNPQIALFSDFLAWAQEHPCETLQYLWRKFKERPDKRSAVATVFHPGLPENVQTDFMEWLESRASADGDALLMSNVACMDPFGKWVCFERVRTERRPIRGVVMHALNSGGAVIEVLAQWLPAGSAAAEADALAEDCGFHPPTIRKVASEARAFLRSGRVAAALTLRCPWRAVVGLWRLPLAVCDILFAIALSATVLLVALCFHPPESLPALAATYVWLAGSSLGAGWVVFAVLFFRTWYAGCQAARELDESQLCVMRYANEGEPVSGDSYSGAVLIAAVADALRHASRKMWLWDSWLHALVAGRNQFCISTATMNKGSERATHRIKLLPVGGIPEKRDVVTRAGNFLLIVASDHARETAKMPEPEKTIPCRWLEDALFAAVGWNVRCREGFIVWASSFIHHRTRAFALALSIPCIPIIAWDAPWIAAESEWESEGYSGTVIFDAKPTRGDTILHLDAWLRGASNPERYRIRWSHRGWPVTEPKSFRPDGECIASFRYDLESNRIEDLDTHQVVKESDQPGHDIMLDRGRFILFYALSWRERVKTRTPSFSVNTQSQ